jgi:dUTP pyrophosphatase
MEIAYNGPEPAKAHRHDAAFDLVSKGCHTILPMERAIILTGLKIALPDGHAGLVIPRSGLAATYGITVLNAPGLIDPEYTGDIGVILMNFGKEHFVVNPGMRIAQLMVVKHEYVKWTYVDDLDVTSRGDGFGSSGL